MKIETCLSGEDRKESRNSQHTGWKERVSNLHTLGKQKIIVVMRMGNSNLDSLLEVYEEITWDWET